MTIKCGVQSWCFNKTKINSEVALKVKEIGLDSIELCGAHIDFHNPATYQESINAYENNGIEIISTGVNKILATARDRNLFEFAKAAGTKHMSVNFSLDNIDAELKSAEALAEEYDMKLGIHNHGGGHWLGNEETMSWVLGKTSKRIGLCLDTAWAIDARQDPVKWIEKFADQLYNVHFKDFTYLNSRQPNDVAVGTGLLDLEKCIETLKKIGYAGISVLECEGDPKDPIPALLECVNQMKKYI